jgi:hypothetical protein
MSAKKSSRKKPSRKKPSGKKASRKTTTRSPASRAAAAKPAQVLEVLFRNEITPNRYDDSAAAARAGARKGGLLLRQVRGWRVAESLQRLLEQVNQMAPGRNKASDGSIGDPRHQSRASDHTPWSLTAMSAWSRPATSLTTRAMDATLRKLPTGSWPPGIRG